MTPAADASDPIRVSEGRLKDNASFELLYDAALPGDAKLLREVRVYVGDGFHDFRVAEAAAGLVRAGMIAGSF